MQRERVNILLVDGGESNLLALEALLREESVELIKAKSGEEALEILLTCDFCLALLDVQMPEMDCFELAQYMRGTERTRSIPIIFLTAMATDERRRFRGYETGAVDYLLKPFEPQMLQSKVAVFVELYRQRQDLARQRDELRDSAERLSEALDRLRTRRQLSLGGRGIRTFAPRPELIERRRKNLWMDLRGSRWTASRGIALASSEGQSRFF